MADVKALRSFQVRQGHPDFLDLPWHLPLAAWREGCPRTVQVQRGVSRHEVVFVGYGDIIYAVKELPAHLAEREYGLLRELENRRLPAVLPVGHALVRRPGVRLDQPDARVPDAEPSSGTDEAEVSMLVTRYLDASLPYRSLFMHRGLERYRKRLLGTMASLLVQLHLSGFYWGDCSLSNTLFRRDAGALQAHVVDVETSETHESLSDGQRRHDLDILEENVTGELADLSALLELPKGLDVYETGRLIVRRYEGLWKEVTREEVIPPGERYRIQERIRALNNLGFTVDEVELIPAPDGSQLRMRTLVTDRDYHMRVLHSLTGIVASDVQARLVLNDVHEFKASLSREQNRSVPVSSAAFRWLEEVYEPAVKRLAQVIEAGTDVPELYCEVLEHKWFLSERAKHDVGMENAIADYLEWYQQERRAEIENLLPASEEEEG